MSTSDLIQLQDCTLDVSLYQQFVTTASCGGQVLFVGTVRQRTDPGNTGFIDFENLGRIQTDNLTRQTSGEDPPPETVALQYEAYPPFALKAMRQLVGEIREQFPVQQVVLVHRIGHVPVGQAAIVIAANSQHRKAAFQAVESMIDQVKQRIPIWKRECLADGTGYWVHPKPASTNPG